MKSHGNGNSQDWDDTIWRRNGQKVSEKNMPLLKIDTALESAFYTNQ